MFVLGLAGVTNSGKTTLVTRFIEKFPGSMHINQDQYFRLEDDPNHVFVEEVDHNNWELLTALDMDKMFADIKTILDSEKDSNNKLLILEGFLVLNDPRITHLCQLKIYIDLPYDECFRRRQTRVYDPPDKPNYFEVVVWPMSRKNKTAMLKINPDTVLIQGTDTQEHIFVRICNLLKKAGFEGPTS